MATKEQAAIAFANQARNSSPELTAALPPITQDNWGDAYNVLAGKTALMNIFRNNLDNILANGPVQSFSAENDWKEFKEAHPYGAGVKETYIGMVDVFPYELTNIERNELKREITQAWESAYVTNLRRYYKQTLGDIQFRELVTTLDGVYAYSNAFVDAQYQSVEWDDKVLTITLIQDAILKGKFAVVPVDMTDPKNLVKQLQAYAFNITEPRREFNSLGVPYSTPKNRQVLILSSEMQAALNVDVTSAAYNEWAVSYGDRIKQVAYLDRPYDQERVEKLAAINDKIPVINDDQGALLAGVKAVLIDERALRIFDNVFEMWDEGRLNSTMERQYFLHVWQTWAVSPWGNGIVFVDKTTSTAAPATITANVTDVSARDKGYTRISVNFDDVTTSLVTRPYLVATSETSAANMSVSRDGTITFADGSAGAKLSAMIADTKYETATAVTPTTAVGTKLTFAKV